MAEKDDFGLAAIGKSLLEGVGLTRKRHEEELRQQARKNVAVADQRRITESSARISQGLVDNLGGLVSVLDDTEKGKQEIETLKANGDLASSLEVIGKQIRDPGKYTREGRNRRVAETTQMINARTQVAAIQQSALADMSKVVDAKLAEAGSDLEHASLVEQQNQQLVQAEMTRVQTMAQTLANNNALQEQKLAMMSEEEIVTATQKAGGKPIDVGGVLLSPGQLEARINVINERKYQEQARAALAAQKNDAAAKLANQKILQTMNLEELRPILMNGDARFDSVDVKQIYDIKMAAQADEMARLGMEFQYQDFGASVTVPAMEDANRMSVGVPKNSLVERALNEYKQTIGTVMGTSKLLSDQGIEMPVEARKSGAEAINESKARLDKAIEKEATIKSRGDKQLKDAYTQLYRGEPVDPAGIEIAITGRLNKGLPLDDVLPQETAQIVRNRYNELVQKFQKENIMGTMDRETIKRLASQQAIAEGIGQTITARTQDMFTKQLQDPTNPLYGSIQPNAMLGMIAKADGEGTADFKRTYNLTDEEFTRFSQGQPIEGKVTAAQRAELGVIQGQRLLMQLDAVQPGLAKRYTDWWNAEGPRFAEQMQQNRISSAQRTGLQAAAMEAFAGNMEKEGQYAYMSVINQAFDSYEGAKDERFNSMVSFDYKPEHRQAALLQRDGTLNDGERAEFMKGFIFPIMRKAKEANLSYEDTNELIEKAIDANVAEDPRIAKLLNKVAKNRSAITEDVESIMQKPFWRAQNPNLRKQYNRKYEWYENIAGDM